MPDLPSLLSVLGQIAQRLGPRGLSPGNSIDDEKQLQRHVVRGSDCLRCCQQARVATYGKVLGILNDVLALLPQADGQNALVMVPIAGTSAFRVAATVVGDAVVAGPLLVGSLILASSADFVALSQSKGIFDAVSIITTAIGLLQSEELQSNDRKKRTKRALGDCWNCVKRRTLSQSHRRKKMTAKINRRL